MTTHYKTAIATSFADPADIARFRAAKARGLTDRQAFAFGDNGIGCWGDDTTADRPMVALPPEDWRHLGKRARGALVIVRYGDRRTIAALADTMPKRANIKNGAGIDLNPRACRELGVAPPCRIGVLWAWAPEPPAADVQPRSLWQRLTTWLRRSLKSTAPQLG